jgi:2-(1,2-epoxy-1,2-dihydrophenyl)acetyl-CoA isomerase
VIAQQEAQGTASRLYNALKTGDRATLQEVLDPGFVGHTTPGLPLGLGGTYEGPRAMGREFWGRIGQNYTLTAIPSKYSLLIDGSLLVEGIYEGQAIGGSELRAEFMHLITFKDRRISGLRQLTDSQLWAEALVGVDARSEKTSETVTKPDAPHDTSRKATQGSAARDVTIEGAREYERLTFASSNGLATVTLDRPAARNALDLVMAQELLQVAVRLAEDPNLRAVHLRANGRAFTVGGDIDVFSGPEPEELGGLLRTMTAPYHDALAILAQLSAPIVCEVNGAAAGGGLGLLYVSDIVIAGTSAKFASGFSALGLSGDGANSWYLPKLIGVRRAAEFYFEQRVLSATEAAEWGLITREVPDEELQREALDAALRIANGPTVALGKIRSLLHHSWGSSLPEQLVAESANLATTSRTKDAANAISSFINKQSPNFKGQ